MEEQQSGPLVKTNTENDDDKEISFSDAVRQILASCCVFTLVIQAGVNMSFSAVLLPQLASPDSEFGPITTDEASWIASLVTLSLPIGSLCVGPLMDKWGRRRVSQLCGLPFLLSWLAVCLSTQVPHLYIARTLAGIAAGFTTVCLVYVSEITHRSYRSMLLSLNSVFVSLGILITCTLGVKVYWKTQALVYCVLAALTIVLHSPLPESPHWLHLHQPDKLQKSLRWIYTNPEVYDKQLRSHTDNRNVNPSVTTINRYFQRTVYRPTALLFFIFLFQQLSGAYVIIFYAFNIFKEIGGGYEDISLVVLGVIRFVMSVVSLVLSKRIGRRPLLFISGLGMSISCVVASLLLYYDSLLVVLCVLAYVSFGALGFLVIPWTLTGELLPVRVRGVVSGLMVTIAYLIMFVIVKVFPFLMESLDLRVVFLIFSLNSFLAVVIVYRWLPETFGKSFAEIESHFRS